MKEICCDMGDWKAESESVVCLKGSMCVGDYYYDKESQFPGKFGNTGLAVRDVWIDHVIFSAPVVKVFWSDGDTTIAKASEGDAYNREFGLSLCVMKKVFGKKQTSDLLKMWNPNYIAGDGVILPHTVHVTLKDIRKVSRANNTPEKEVAEVAEEV